MSGRDQAPPGSPGTDGTAQPSSAVTATVSTAAAQRSRLEQRRASNREAQRKYLARKKQTVSRGSGGPGAVVIRGRGDAATNGGSRRLGAGGGRRN
jgi:hypothetical protein